MSAIATFTLRDLNRQPAKVLAAVRKFGSAEVRTRAGEVFTVAAKKPEPVGKGRKRKEDIGKEFEQLMNQRRDRMRARGCLPPSPGEFDNERFNQIIAGER